MADIVTAVGGKTCRARRDRVIFHRTIITTAIIIIIRIIVPTIPPAIAPLSTLLLAISLILADVLSI